MPWDLRGVRGAGVSLFLWASDFLFLEGKHKFILEGYLSPRLDYWTQLMVWYGDSPIPSWSLTNMPKALGDNSLRGVL